MTKFGETHHFSGKDFVIKLEECLEQKVSGIIGNSTKPANKILDIYRQQKSDFVRLDMTDSFWSDRKLYLADILDTHAMIVRHDPGKLVHIIKKILNAGLYSIFKFL